MRKIVTALVLACLVLTFTPVANVFIPDGPHTTVEGCSNGK